LPVPLLLPTIFWCVGIGLATFLQVPVLWLIFFSLFTIILGLFFRFRLPFLLMIIALAGFVRLSVTVYKPTSPLQKLLNTRESITQPCTGEVLRVLNPDYNLYLVKITSINQAEVSEKAMMYAKKTLIPGDKFRALSMFSLRRTDPALDNVSFYQAQRLQRTQVILKPVYRLESLQEHSVINLERTRYQLLQVLQKKLGNAAPFAKALLLNDRTGEREWIEQLIQGGLLHLIAISGMHVLFFYFVFVTLLNVFLPRKTSELIFIVLMIVYAGFCQWSAPVMRAIVMILLYLIAKWLQRPVAPLQIICLSLLIITLIDPVQLFSVGLQLSYLCIIVIIYVIPKWRFDLRHKSNWRKRYLHLKSYFLETLTISAAVSLVLLPLSLYYFLRGSLNAIIGNLFGIPLIALLLPLTFTLMVLPSGWFVYDWLYAGFNILYFLFQKWVVWTAGLPFYIDTVVVPTSMLIAIYLIIAALAVRIRTGLRLQKLTYILLILAIPFAAWTWIPKSKSFSLTVFNDGQGDCTLVEYPTHETLMIDTGPRYYDSKTNQASGWFGKRTAAWQQKRRINQIDLLVLTHLDADHSGGLEDVFKQMRVKRLMINKQSASTKEWQQLLKTGFLQEAQIIILQDTLSFNFAGSKIAILHPGKDFMSSSANDNSIVLRLDYKNFSALMAADISSEVEMKLINEYPDKLDADFLKAPHHGSRQSSSAPFIRAVSPRQVCITAARNNQFGFPHQETLARYRAYGIEPRITGNGSVIVTIK